MANRYVRIYEGPQNSTIIGFSASAIPSNRDSLHSFFRDRLYETHEYGVEEGMHDYAVIKHLGGVSAWYMGITPPILEGDIPNFAEYCKRHVDPYHNSALLIDNRQSQMPLEPYTTDGVIARW